MSESSFEELEPFADAWSDDPDQDLVAELLADIDAGRLTLEAAIAKHPHLEPALRDAEALRKLLKTAQVSSIPDAPKNLGEFSIVGIIGQGGMGVVYRARHERLGREVAVKTIRPTQVSPPARERFLREQKALARLHQTHIVPIYAAGSDGAVEYFVMPYIEGASLARVLEALRRGEARALSKSDTLFSLVDSTDPRTSGARSRSVIAPNGSASRSASRRQPVTVAEPEPTPAAPPRSREYFRSAATIIAGAAEALEHAHRRGVCHRDLKPNNIMLAADGRMWVIDFGLASFQAPDRDDAGPLLAASDAVLTNAAVGTWSYMAPEQFASRASPDPRTDVFGLGVTLYEMLTLRRAFAHRSKSAWDDAAAADPPPHPSLVAPALPADLAAICWKAMSKNAAARYQSAGELAEDLRRWLRDEPVLARPRPLLEQVQRWTAKHRAWALLILFLSLAIPSIIGLQYRASAKAQATLAEQSRQLVVRDLESLLYADKRAGWSAKALKKIGDAAAVRKDAALEDAALAAFAGLDAELLAPRLETIGASSAAYDSTVKRLVLGGVEARRDRSGSPAHVWNLDAPAPTPGKAEGPGLVAFRRDGAPVQLVIDKTGRLRLLHVMTGETLREFTGHLDQPHGEPPIIALTHDAERVAASFSDGNETFIWAGAAKPTRLHVGASALSFSKDGALLATGAPSGETTIWTTADGKRLAAFQIAPLEVQALAFNGRSALRDGKLDGELAVGAYGRCAIVDLATGKANCFFETEEHVVRALAFAPDDATVAADGWIHDAATGRRLLQVGGHVFSPDGAEVCEATGAGFALPRVHRYALKTNRGVLMLHGLRTPAARLAFSKDARTLAALSRDWRVAVWDVETGRLLRLSGVPEGPFADNADVALDPDGRRVAVASGKAAVLWEVATGRRLKEWSLPPGFGNRLAFTAAGELLLVRTETKSMDHYPAREFPFPEHPRAIRGRNLLSPTPEKPLFQLDAFARHIYEVALTPDGARILAEGLSPDGPRGERSARLFDAHTGAELRRYPITHSHDYGSPRTDPTGAALLFVEENDPLRYCVIAADGAPGDALFGFGTTLGPRAETWLADCPGFTRRVRGVYQRGRAEPLYRLTHFDVGAAVLFSADGRRLAFETPAGAVGLIDFPHVEENLHALGLR